MATLKISELSVGDWVRYDGAPYRVYSLDEYGVVNARNGNGTRPQYIEIYISKLEPLPITRQILEDSDVHYVDTFDDGARLYACDCCSIVERSGRWNLCTPRAQVNVAHIHQLQHALRLAGVDEEINL